jgi:PHD/YefM family antitoxin component YafN of YafNO toxin-antitoxin module
VSGAILQALLEEYKEELTVKTAKLDSDPHFWMPLTLSEDDYVYLMTQKNIEEAESKAHYQRMKVFSDKFDRGSLGLFGAVNVGKDACWWDYGQLKLYSKNTKLLLDDANPESVLLRKFLGVDAPPDSNKRKFDAGDLVLEHSYAFASTIQSGSVKDSLVCQVSTKELNANGAILVNCVAPKITAGKGSILYNLMSEQEITAEDGQVMVAVTSESGESFVLKSRMDIDGGNAWKTVVEGNEFSFEQVHKNNKDANIAKIDKERSEHFKKLAASLGL